MWPFVIRAFKGGRHINLFLYNDDRFTTYKTAYVGLCLNILETGTLNTASLVAFSGTEYRRRNGIIILLDTFCMIPTEENAVWIIWDPKG